MDPNQQPGQPEQPDPQKNEFIPPAPGAYAPHDQFEKPAEKKPKKQEGMTVDSEILKKKRQARILMGATILFALLFLVGLLVIVTAIGSSSDDEESQEMSMLSTEEQLRDDVNTLGLAIINYNNGNEPFEIVPQDVGELKVAYLQQDFNDPRTGEPYTLVTSIPEVGELQYIIGGVCNSDDSISQSGDDTRFAIRVLLETENQLYCLESSEVRQPTR